MDRKIKQILNIVEVVVAALWLGNLFGVFDFVQGFHIGRWSDAVEQIKNWKYLAAHERFLTQNLSAIMEE